MNKLAQVASTLQAIGADGSSDTVLAHITPKEAALLKARGGSGRIDPNTGLPHFEDDSEDSSSGGYAYSNPAASYASIPAYMQSPQSYGSSSTYSGTPGSWNGYAGVNGVGNPDYEYSDPAVDKKGYYSSDSGASGGSDFAHYYADRRTLGGDLANRFGWDPEGFFSKLVNGGLAAFGAINPGVGLFNKVAQAAIGAQSDPHQIDAEGNGGTLNFAGRLLGNNKLANALGMTLDPNQQKKNEDTRNEEERYSSSSGSSSDDEWWKKKKKYQS